nr:hypothetical protein [uncultured Sulfurimonas sp.]
MTLTNRTKLSLVQFLDLQDYQHINILFEKYSLDDTCRNILDIRETILDNDISSLLKEIVGTRQALKNRVDSKTSFNERWDELIKCLYLDGYKIEDNKLISIQPYIPGTIAIEDDLTHEILQSNLSKIDDIVKFINESAEAFKKTTPDYNGCLSKVRLAIETMVRDIANDTTCTNKCWGKALHQLKASGLLTQDEEQAIASTYTFVSDGSHIPLGFTHEEYARYGRNLILSVCYFMIKKYNHYI